MRLRRFLSVSVIIHLLIAAGIYYLPKAKQPEKQGFLTRLVTPEEAGLPQISPPEPPLYRKPPERVQGPVPPARPSKRQVPPLARPPLRTPDVTPEQPLIPGEGPETGTPLPRGQQPSPAEAPSPARAPRTEPGVRSERTPGTARQGGSLRSRLFDQAVTSDIAGRDTSARPGRDDAITFDTRDYRYTGYMNKLRDKIQSIWVYPPSAAAEGKYGDLKIRFTIKKDGRLARVELVRTSGYRLLDEAAMKALKDGEPYWPLPDEWGMETYTILGHFIYSLYGYQQLR